MAKLQKKNPPRSSMSRLLDENAFAGALSIEEESPETFEETKSPALRVIESPPARVPDAAPLTRTVQPRPALRAQPKSTIVRGGELYLTERSNQILQEIIATLRANNNHAIASTHVFRGLLLALGPHLANIKQEAAAAGPMKRPGNETQYALEREEFEKAIGEMVLAAVKG